MKVYIVLCTDKPDRGFYVEEVFLSDTLAVNYVKRCKDCGSDYHYKIIRRTLWTTE